MRFGLDAVKCTLVGAANDAEASGTAAVAPPSRFTFIVLGGATVAAPSS